MLGHEPSQTRQKMACCGRQQTKVKPQATAGPTAPAPPSAPPAQITTEVTAEVAAAVAARPPRNRQPGGARQQKGPQPKQLLRAAKDGDAATIAQLLDAGLDIEHRGMWGNNPLLCACAYGSDAVAALLIKRGAEVAVENEDGATALMLGCLEGLSEAVGLMLASGSPPTLWPPPVIVYNKDTDSSSPQTPLRAACENGHVALLSALLDHIPAGGGSILELAPDGAVAEAVVAAAKHGHVGVLQALGGVGVPVGSCVNAAGKTAMDVGTVEVTDFLNGLGQRQPTARSVRPSAPHGGGGRGSRGAEEDSSTAGGAAAAAAAVASVAQPDSARAAEPAATVTTASTPASLGCPAATGLSPLPPSVVQMAPPPAAVAEPLGPRPPATGGGGGLGPPRGARQLKPLNAPPPTVVQDAPPSLGLTPMPPPASVR